MSKLTRLLILTFLVLSNDSFSNGKFCLEYVEPGSRFTTDTIPKGTDLGDNKSLRNEINDFIAELDTGDRSLEKFDKLINQLPETFKSPELSEMAYDLGDLERTLTLAQEKIIFLVSILGKYEKQSGKLLNYADSYSWRQIRRKNMLLEMAGFKTEERSGILWGLGDRVFSNLESFYALHAVDSRVAKISNQNVLRDLTAYKPGASPGKLSKVTKKEAEFIYSLTYDNPVSSLNVHDRYTNPLKMSHPGYCWGRAMTSQIEAITRGVSPDAIKKVFAVGDLRTGSTDWWYHVSTLIKGEGNTWWAIDPIMEKVIPIEEWVVEMNKFNPKKNMRLFVSNGDRFAPTSNKPFDLKSDDHNNYFFDLMNYFNYRGKVTPLNEINASNFNQIANSEKIKARKFPKDAPPITNYRFKALRESLLVKGIIGAGAAYGAYKGYKYIKKNEPKD